MNGLFAVMKIIDRTSTLGMLKIAKSKAVCFSVLFTYVIYILVTVLFLIGNTADPAPEEET